MYVGPSRFAQTIIFLLEAWIESDYNLWIWSKRHLLIWYQYLNILAQKKDYHQSTLAKPSHDQQENIYEGF